MKKVVVISFLFLTVFSFSAKPRAGFYFGQNAGGSLNPLGLALVTSFYYRIPLFDSDDILLKSTKIDIGLENSISPADERLTFAINIEPVAVFDISVKIGFSSAYKLLGYGFIDVPNYSSEFSDEALKYQTQQDKTAFYLRITPRLKAQFGPVIVANSLDWVYLNWGNEDKYYFNSHEGLIMKYNESCFINASYLLFEITGEIIAGLNYNILWGPASGYNSQYLAAVGIYTVDITQDFNFTFNALGGMYFTDRYYTYQPYIAIQASINLKI